MLFYQMTRIAKDKGSLKHDDRLDALTMACTYFVESLDVDQHMQEATAKEEALDAALDKFVDEWYEGHSSTKNQGLKLWGR